MCPIDNRHSTENGSFLEGWSRRGLERVREEVRKRVQNEISETARKRSDQTRPPPRTLRVVDTRRGHRNINFKKMSRALKRFLHFKIHNDDDEDEDDDEDDHDDINERRRRRRRRRRSRRRRSRRRQRQRQRRRRPRRSTDL